MPIIIAIILHKLGHYLPLWIIKKRFVDVRAQFEWKQIFIEMNGVIANFVIALIIVSILTLTTKEKYLLNKNAIYGIEISELAEQIGFKNGDKIITINKTTIERFNDILPTILLENGDVEVVILRDDSTHTVYVTNNDKARIIKGDFTFHFKPRLRPDSITESIDNLKYELRQKGVADIFKEFSYSIQMTFRLVSPNQKGGFIALKTDNLNGILYAIATSSILIGLLNLIPLPGLDVGNTVIAFFELKRKSKFNEKRLKLMRIIFSSLIIISLLIIIFLT